jgi:para-nitrobenzyl esterase
LRRPLRIAALLLAVAAVVATAPNASGSPNTLRGPEPAQVRVSDGAVRGTIGENFRLFQGIPFAAPPVGDLRWRPPQKPAAWSGVRDATAPASPCPQVRFPALSLPSNQTGSVNEDCLYLNVWTPPTRSLRERPVFVWLHGGANAIGAGSDYNAEMLTRTGDIVVVTVNYRLGALGFLAHPALSAEAADRGSGNYGMMDQQAALRWVQQNIRAFGGDPRRVTLGGQSAGSQDTCDQIASPTAKGLFAQAIQMSGSCVSAGIFVPPTLNAASVTGQTLGTAMGCPPGPTAAACLRALTPAQLIAGAAGRTWSPNLHPTILPISPAQAWANGRASAVPTLMGSTHDEWRFFTSTRINLISGPLTPERYAAVIAAEFPGIAPTLLEQYPASAFASASLAYSALKTDESFACPARADAILYSGRRPVYSYEFNDPNAPATVMDPNLAQGAFHSADVPFIFRRAPLNAAQDRLSRTMVGFFTNFINDGDPNGRGLPDWPRYRASGDGPDRLSDLQLSLVPDAIRITSGFAADHKCGFWQAVAGIPA